jgi:hypothetical protein
MGKTDILITFRCVLVEIFMKLVMNRVKQGPRSINSKDQPSMN